MWDFLGGVVMILLCILLTISPLIPGMIRECGQERMNNRYKHRNAHHMEYLLLYRYDEKGTFDGIWKDRETRQRADNESKSKKYRSMKNIRDRLNI